MKDVGVAGGIAKPKGPDQAAFGSPPKAGDALYIAFDVPLANMLLEVDVDCSQARGAGVDPEDPPLRWEVSVAEEESGWLEAEVVEDLTGGFNYGAGKVTIQLPDAAHGRSDRRPSRLLGLLPPRHQDALGRLGVGELHAPAGDPRDHGRTDRRDHPRRSLGAGDRRGDRDERRDAGPDLRSPLLPDPRPDPGGVPRDPRPGHGDLGEVGAGRVVRREQADRHAITS